MQLYLVNPINLERLILVKLKKTPELTHHCYPDAVILVASEMCETESQAEITMDWPRLPVSESIGQP